MAELYRKDDLQRIAAGIFISKYPNQFYGIGPKTSEEMEEDYTSLYTNIRLQYGQKVWRQLQVGLRYRFYYEEISKFESGGLLSGGKVPGSDGGITSGVGPVFTWDTRNNIFYTTKGSYLNVYSMFHLREFGSDYNFVRYVVDARKYFIVHPKSAVAFQLYGESVSGEAPFSIMSLLGGSRNLRGYYEGRFRDNNVLVMQAEYRFPFFWRFKASVFGGFGNVMPRLDEFNIKNIKFAAGAGLRFLLSKEGVHLRADYAVGQEGGKLYLTLMEAF